MLDTVSLITSIIVLLIALALSVYYAKKNSKLKRLLIPQVIISFILFYPLSIAISFFIAFLFPNSKVVPCFLVSDSKCEERVDCSLTIVDGGLGKETTFCTNNN